MEAMTGRHSDMAARTSDMWPSCSAPMVGTKPAGRPSARAWRATCFIHSMVWMVSNDLCFPRDSGAGARGSFAIEDNQVCRNRLRTQLPQQRSDLTAMIGGMVRELMQGLPKCI